MRLNQHGAPVPRSIDDPHGDDEATDEGMFGGFGVFGDYDDEAGFSSGSDCETSEPPVTFERKRALAVSAEVYGACNPRRTFTPPVNEKTPEQVSILREAFEKSLLFQALSEQDLEPIVQAMTVVTPQAGEDICRQGEDGDALFVVLSGAVDLYKDENSDRGADVGFPAPDSTKEPILLRTLPAPTVFGELALLWNMPRSLTVRANLKEPCTLGRLDREVFQHCVIQCEMEQREQRHEGLRNVKLLEMMEDEQIAKLADALKLRTFNQGEHLITQGEQGNEFFILVQGECVASVATKFLGVVVDEQEHRRYHAGELFGERAILRGEPRSASVIASVDNTQALTLTRGKFERLLGQLDQLQENQYLTDPRKIIADFYQSGDFNGPAGSIAQQGGGEPRRSMKESERSSWFAVYRPTSRDAIAKMLSGDAVGKGLNVKGKSAKKGVLSGFVPFLQISDNEHKEHIEASPSGSRIHLYFRNSSSRDTALAALYAVMFESGAKLVIDEKKIKMLDSYKPDAFGLELPEPLVKEAYIMNPDIIPRIGWETGRASEPAFMDMNLHAVRDDSLPKVVLWQFDEGDPMNPRGLLIAYAEQFVKPVVSDFDTFTIGSRNMKYEPLPASQGQLATWSLEHARSVLSEPGEVSWTARWLEILKKEAEKGFHPEFPKYGFGDPTSYRLIGDVVQATISCGAVRHGAECFNFYFPQELDNEYLVVWEDFPDKPWDYKDEKSLRQFLIERVEEGFIFPLNPVWPIRDKGWYKVLEALRQSQEAAAVSAAWDPPGLNINEKIEEIHKLWPSGFEVIGQEPDPATSSRPARSTADMFGADMFREEKADLAHFEIKRNKKFTEAVDKVKFVNALNKTTVVKRDETLEGGPVFSGPNQAAPPSSFV